METVTEPKTTGQLLRVLFQGRILKGYITDLLESETVDPNLRLSAHQTMGQVKRLESLIKQNTEEGTYPWLEKDSDIKWDIAAVADLMERIHIEEKQSVYDELLALLIQSLTAILYSRDNRKKIYFHKYKAIFQLIAEELKADTDRRSGTFLFDKGELYIRTNSVTQTLKQ